MSLSSRENIVIECQFATTCTRKLVIFTVILNDIHCLFIWKNFLVKSVWNPIELLLAEFEYKQFKFMS